MIPFLKVLITGDDRPTCTKSRRRGHTQKLTNTWSGPQINTIHSILRKKKTTIEKVENVPLKMAEEGEMCREGKDN